MSTTSVPRMPTGGEPAISDRDRKQLELRRRFRGGLFAYRCPTTEKEHGVSMRKLIVLAATVIGIAALIQRLRVTASRIDWEQRFERLPDNAPPKWMFRNIAAIRQNTDDILAILQREGPGEATSTTGPPTA